MKVTIYANLENGVSVKVESALPDDTTVKVLEAAMAEYKVAEPTVTEKVAKPSKKAKEPKVPAEDHAPKTMKDRFLIDWDD